ncbi:MAG: 2-hydroxyacid dehydrogenase [Pseudomonadota bacterium]
MAHKVLVIGNFFPSVMEDLKAKFDVVQTDRDGLAAMDDADLADVEAFATFGWAPADLIDRMPKLKLVSSFGVGYDGVAAEYAAGKGVICTHTPNVLNDDVANCAIALMLMTTRRLVEHDRYLRDGKWVAEGNAPLTTSVRGKQVGIVGLGRIGEAIAEKLAVFKCKTVYHSRNKKDVAYDYYDSLLQMARDSDVLIVITPGGPETDKLISRDIMEALGPKGTLINVARGTVVDEQELIAALKDGRLGNAGLDVFEEEPKVPQELIDMEHVVLTPHVASATWETRQDMSDLVVENIVTFFESGKPTAPVPESAHLVEV